MKRCDRRQLLALGFVFSLAPMIRLLPKVSTREAGSGSWLTPLIALPFIILYIVFLSAFLRHRREGEGMAQMIRRGTGSIMGGAALVLIACNALFYCGFILSSGADRFVTAIYPAASPIPFIIIMLALGTAAAMGKERSVIRTAKVFSPMIAAVLVLVLLFGLISVNTSYLLPVARNGAEPLLRGAVSVLDIYVGVMTYCSFFEGECSIEKGRTKGWILWLLPLIALCVGNTAAVVGRYGPGLTESLSHPYFTMLRDITLFGTIERIEAFVVTLWIIPDFIVFSAALTVAVQCLMTAFDYKPSENSAYFDLSNGRWLIPLCAFVSAVVAFAVSENAANMDHYSTRLVPLLNLGVSLFILPVCYIVGRLRKKI